MRERYSLQHVHAGINGLLDCNLDAVVISASDAFHPDLTVTALEASLHVVCEKPLALTLAGCDRIATAHDRAGKVLAGRLHEAARLCLQARWTCCHRIIELTFLAPYLRHEPTRLTLKRSGGGHALETAEFHASYEDAFREQLRAFHAAACGDAPVSTPAEQARRDVEFLISAFREAYALTWL